VSRAFITVVEDNHAVSAPSRRPSWMRVLILKGKLDFSYGERVSLKLL